MSEHEIDVAIVGGGIVGVACAHACAREGLRVLVIEKHGLASGTTGSATGHLVTAVGSDAIFALTQYSQRLWKELDPGFPESVGFQPCGAIWLGRTDTDREDLERLKGQLDRRDVGAQLVDSKELHRLEPNLAPEVTVGLVVSDDAVVDPRGATDFLWHTAQALGARLLEGRWVSSVKGVNFELDHDDEIPARCVVVAAGIDSVRLVPELPVRPRKGNLARVGVPAGFVRHQLLEVGYLRSVLSEAEDSIAFNMQPTARGGVIVGSSRQFGVAHSEVDPVISEALLTRARGFVPSIAEYPVLDRWAGLRPASADHLPLIGPLPNRPDIFVAAGHEGLGITASLATGRLVADMILGRPSAIPVDPYLPRGRLAPRAGAAASGPVRGPVHAVGGPREARARSGG